MMLLKPPTSVPGPYQSPALPPRVAAVSKPVTRVVVTPRRTTFFELAMKYYGNSSYAYPLFNANRNRFQNQNQDIPAGSTVSLL